MDVFFFAKGGVVIYQAMFKIAELAKLVEEPFINHGETVDVFHGHATIESFIYGK